MSKKYFSYILFLVVTAVTATACGKQYPDPPQNRSHTLIVYMGGDDNGLAGETSAKIQYMTAANINALRNAYSNILIYQDANGPRLWKLNYTEETIPPGASLENMPGLELLYTYPAENSASPEVFARVIQDCMREAPADSYGLWIFSHATGWLPTGALANPIQAESSPRPSRSIIFDGENEMALSDFASAIPDHTFEYIVFEACFMAGIEVAYELRNKTDYIIGSSAEMLSPGFTDLYRETIPYLFNPDMSTLGALANIARAYFNHWNNLSGWEQSATISVIRTDALEGVVQATREIFANNNPSPEITSLQYFNRQPHKLFFDFEEYLATLATPQQTYKLKSAIDAAVPYQAATPDFLKGQGGFEINHHSGFTIYIPQAEFSFLNSEYEKLEWARAVR